MSYRINKLFKIQTFEEIQEIFKQFNICMFFNIIDNGNIDWNPVIFYFKLKNIKLNIDNGEIRFLKLDNHLITSIFCHYYFKYKYTINDFYFILKYIMDKYSENFNFNNFINFYFISNNDNEDISQLVNDDNIVRLKGFLYKQFNIDVSFNRISSSNYYEIYDPNITLHPFLII